LQPEHRLPHGSPVIAASLICAGPVPEIILNLAKCIEILFGSDRDGVRRKCNGLGYSNEEIEGQIREFSPISTTDLRDAA
jgi:hypothetical protein